ncbi:hypothetical protein vseg_007029 [Gypsophila vaccaria]
MAVMVEQNPTSKKQNYFSKNKKNNNNIQQQKISRATVLDAISKGGKITSYTAEDGTIKMKILVKKQDLKQILGAMNNVGLRDRPTTVLPPATTTPLSTIERRLVELKRRKKANALAKGSHLSSWTPQLQSIPEEH